MFILGNNSNEIAGSIFRNWIYSNLQVLETHFTKCWPEKIAVRVKLLPPPDTLFSSVYKISTCSFKYHTKPSQLFEEISKQTIPDNILVTLTCSV